MAVQIWGCDKCTFKYYSPVKVKQLDHHCPPLSRKTAAAKLIEGDPVVVTERQLANRERNRAKNLAEKEALAAAQKPRGRVLKRR